MRRRNRWRCSAISSSKAAARRAAYRLSGKPIAERPTLGGTVFGYVIAFEQLGLTVLVSIEGSTISVCSLSGARVDGWRNTPHAESSESLCHGSSALGFTNPDVHRRTMPLLQGVVSSSSAPLEMETWPRAQPARPMSRTKSLVRLWFESSAEVP